jgi:hypothetical protein
MLQQHKNNTGTVRQVKFKAGPQRKQRKIDLPPGGRLLYDRSALNGAEIETECQQQGLTLQIQEG